jgi:mRNA interferase MazF
MSLTFHPDAGTIVICDYSTGFQPPEMVKVRPVVVVSPRRRGSQLVTVVPISRGKPNTRVISRQIVKRPRRRCFERDWG